VLSRRRLALCAVLLLAGCNGAPGPRTLRMADLANPNSLNPLLAHDQETIGNDLLFVQTLTGLDAKNRVVPLLLTQIPSKANGGVSGDGKRITYRLRHNVRFADGVELTAGDVAFTYRAILDPANPVLSQDAYRRIARLETPNRYTVVVLLRAPWNAAVSDLFAQSDFAFGILPAHAFTSTKLAGAAWENHAFGSGPFRVLEWRRGDRIVLGRNPYFSPRPKIDRIELRMIHDANTAFVALRSHGVDVVPLDTPQSIAQASATGGITVVRTPLNGTEWISLQTSQPPANAIAFRRAVAYALDTSAIRKTFNDLFPQAGSFLPPVMGASHDAGIAPYPHDTARARALVGSSGADATIVVQAENPLWGRIAAVMQQQLSSAGIRANIKPFPTALFNAPDGPVRNARFTLAIDRWLGGSDPEQSIVFTCAQANVNGDNISRYCNPQFEALFARQSVTPDERERRSDFLQMQRLVHRDIPVIPLYYMTWYDAVDARVHGFERNMLEYPVAPERWSVTP
jgi:peptide/nickel transport system substrate-binding protein